MKKSMLIITLFVLTTTFCHSAIIRVPADQPTIQAGIDAASPGDTVLVASGTYTGPGNRDITFVGKAIALIAESGPTNTIIDCKQVSRGVRFDSGELQNSAINGFTIIHGSAMNDPVNKAGGGIFCSDASPTISGCIISSGMAVEGAGIYSDGGSPLIDTCTIENNLNSSVGAGISLRGGAPWIVRSLIRGNTVTSNGDSVFGGGLFVLDSNVTLTDCTISANSATDGTGSSSFGGGMYIQLKGYYRTTLTNCLIDSNSALHVISGNGGYGGGLFCLNGSVSVNSCTFAGNTAATNGGPVYAEGGTNVQLFHCISWGNTPTGLHGVASVRHSDIQGGYAGVGNIETDPLFTTGPDGAYYLSHISAGQPADSPCIGAGSESAASTCYAIPGGERCMDSLTTRTDDVIDSGTLDIGFHFPAAAEPTPTQPPAPTPTPTSWTGVQIDLNGEQFTAGDVFELDVSCRGNPMDQYAEMYVLLDVFGDFRFWPLWTSEAQGQLIPLTPDRAVTFSILDFVWPDGSYGETSGLKFWATICKPGTSELIGDFDWVEFGYYR